MHLALLLLILVVQIFCIRCHFRPRYLLLGLHFRLENNIQSGESFAGNNEERANESNIANDSFFGRSRTFCQNVVESEHFPHFVAGIAAGIVECIVGHPLDAIGLVIMSRNWPSVMGAFGSCFGGLSVPGGLLALYRGSGLTFVSCALAGSVEFGVNGFFHRCFGKSIEEDEMEEIDSAFCLAAACTGFLDGITSLPLKPNVAQPPSVHGRRQRTRRMMERLLHCQAGVVCFYREWLPTVARETVCNLAFCLAYQRAKAIMNSCSKQTDETGHAQNIQSGNLNSLIAIDQPQMNPAQYWVNPRSAQATMAVAGISTVMACLLATRTPHAASAVLQSHFPKLAASHVAVLPGACTVVSVSSSAAAAASTGAQATLLHKTNIAASSAKKMLRPLAQGLKRAATRNGLPALYQGAVAVPAYAAAFWGYEVTYDATRKVIDKIKRDRKGR